MAVTGQITELLCLALAAISGLTLGGCIGLVALMWYITSQDHPAYHRWAPHER